jgi:NhaP-type Na+/H+ or K+/H+ antiporter
MGLLLGYLFNEYELFDFEFNEQGFFYFILPPIVFSGGYNLKRRRFFRNFDYICIYGLLNTVLNFILTAVLTWIIVDKGWVIIGYNGSSKTDLPSVVYLSIGEILLFSATICATDTIAALTLIDSQKYQKLFSVILGEGKAI